MIFLVNEMNMAKLPEDDVPESIWTTLERAENGLNGNIERSEYTGDPLEEAVVQGEGNITNTVPITTR